MQAAISLFTFIYTRQGLIPMNGVFIFLGSHDTLTEVKKLMLKTTSLVPTPCEYITSCGRLWRMRLHMAVWEAEREQDRVEEDKERERMAHATAVVYCTII